MAYKMNVTVAAMARQVVRQAARSGLLSSTCTILVPPASDTFNAAGAPDPSVPYTPLPGFVDLVCMDAPISTGDSMASTEVKHLQETEASEVRHLWLAGSYPELLASVNPAAANYDCLVMPEGVQWDIVNAEVDSQRSQTRLALQKATI